MNLNEDKLTKMLEILHKNGFEDQVFTLMALNGAEYMKDPEWNHQEMEVAFWLAFTELMLRPFDKADHPRILQRYGLFLAGIFEELAGMPLPKEEPETK